MRKKEKENKNIIEIKEEVKIGDVILEKGDRVEILDEKWDKEVTYAFTNFLEKYIYSDGKVGIDMVDNESAIFRLNWLKRFIDEQIRTIEKYL